MGFIIVFAFSHGYLNSMLQVLTTKYRLSMFIFRLYVSFECLDRLNPICRQHQQLSYNCLYSPVVFVVLLAHLYTILLSHYCENIGLN